MKIKYSTQEKFDIIKRYVYMDSVHLCGAGCSKQMYEKILNLFQLLKNKLIYFYEINENNINLYKNNEYKIKKIYKGIKYFHHKIMYKLYKNNNNL